MKCTQLWMQVPVLLRYVYVRNFQDQFKRSHLFKRIRSIPPRSARVSNPIRGESLGLLSKLDSDLFESSGRCPAVRNFANDRRCIRRDASRQPRVYRWLEIGSWRCCAGKPTTCQPRRITRRGINANRAALSLGKHCETPCYRTIGEHQPRCQWISAAVDRPLVSPGQKA